MRGKECPEILACGGVPDIGGERGERHQYCQRKETLAPRPDEAQQQRPQNVELLLDAERPEVQHRVVHLDRLEVRALKYLDDVGCERRAGERICRHLLELFGKEIDPAEREARHQDQDERGKDAPDSPGIKIQVREAASLEVAEDDGADEEAGDDEKNVDTDEAPGDLVRKEVKAEDGKYRDRAQAVDVGAISGMDRPVLRRSLDGVDVLLGLGSSSPHGTLQMTKHRRESALKFVRRVCPFEKRNSGGAVCVNTL